MATEIDYDGEAKELQDYWQARDTQIRADRALVNLQKPVQTSDQIKWISNEPKVFYDTAIALVSSYPPRFRLPLTMNFTPEEKDKMNKAERFLLGIFRSLDARQMARGQVFWLRELAYWVLSGWYATFCTVRNGANGVEFIADHWDPLTVYPDWNADGLVRCIRTFEVEKKTARMMIYDWQAKGMDVSKYMEKSGPEQVKIINYWCKDKGGVYNALTIGGTEVKPLTKEPFDDIPIFCGAVGIPEMSSDDWKTRIGEHIVAANRDMYDYTNQIMSLMVTIMAATAYPNIVTKTVSGAPPFKPEDMRGFGQLVPLRIQDQIELLKHASTPEEALQLLQMMLKQEQKGSLPDVVYGGIGTELSGFAISQLLAAIKYKISPYLTTMQYVISRIATEFLRQYRKNKMPKVSLSTMNPKDMRKGQFFVEEFTPKDVPEALFVDVSIPITSPLDKTQQIIFARQALQPPQLISRETLWDEVLDIQDSEQEYARIIQDEILELPIVKQIGAIEQMRKRVAYYQEQGKTMEAQALNQYVMALEMQLGMRQGIPQVPGQAGVPSSFSPPEAGNSPDRNRAAAGTGPPGINRPPQTTEQRQASKQPGQLYNSRGEVVM